MKVKERGKIWLKAQDTENLDHGIRSYHFMANRWENNGNGDRLYLCLLLERKAMISLLLSRFSRVQLCATPQMAAHQAPQSLGFFRQEHWSGLPFPSPMHESEKWKWSHPVSVRLFVTPWTTAYQAPLSMGFSRQEYWSRVPLPSPFLMLLNINY